MSREVLLNYGRRGKGFSTPDHIIIKSMKALHLLAATAWAGSAISMQALTHMRLGIADAAVAAQVGSCIHFIDTWVTIPGLAGCILTGLFYSLFTSIGFFRHAWIGFKWMISLAAAFWGGLFWGPWGDALIVRAADFGLDGFLRLVRACVMPENMWQGLLQTGVIFAMCLISIYRPLSFRFWRGDDTVYDYRHHHTPES